MEEKKENNHSQEVLLSEYSQAWEHYRHLENSRTRYMNFFFTALFAIIGLYSTLLNLKKIEIGEIQVILGITLLQIFILFSLFIFINITRIGWVLKGYNGVKGHLRGMLFEKTHVPDGISVHNYLGKKFKFKIFSVQTSSKTMLILSILFTNAFSIISFKSNWNEITQSYRATLIVLFVVVLLIELIVLIRLIQKR
jgi:drug/metabolite transporter superfamily protein YnfA